MSVFIDLPVRSVLNAKLMEIGTGSSNKRILDLSPLGIAGLTTANTQIVAGEHTSEALDQGLVWVEPFLVKSPQDIYTPSNQGLSRKTYQFTIWVKTPVGLGVFFNEAVSGIIEEHFNNNLHLKLPSNDVVTILKTYQQSVITKDSSTGRLFNRVFVDCETYYKSRK